MSGTTSSIAADAVVSIDCEANQATVTRFDELRKAASLKDDRLLADAYSYAYGKVSRAAEYHRVICTVERSRYVLSCMRRLKVPREEAEATWSRFCENETAKP